jgi:hypothetical protein
MVDEQTSLDLSRGMLRGPAASTAAGRLSIP